MEKENKIEIKFLVWVVLVSVLIIEWMSGGNFIGTSSILSRAFIDIIVFLFVGVAFSGLA